MGQTAFYPDLNLFCMKWARQIPGNVTRYGGPIQTGSEKFRTQFRSHQAALFEQLLLFDSIDFSINGPNVIPSLMYRFMGPKVLEDLLEQDALSFVVWAPTPILLNKDGVVGSTIVGRIGDGSGSELDIERIVDLGLRIQDVNMPDAYRNSIRRKLMDRHTLLDEKIPETAWEVSGDALKSGELEVFGLPKRETILGSSMEDGQKFMDATTAILSYRYILANGMSSQNDDGVFSLFRSATSGIARMRSPMDKYAIVSEYEKFPNLRALYGQVDRPFQLVTKFRHSHTARRFRNWISTSDVGDNSIDIIRDYVNECSKRRGLFESKPAKFLKLVAMVTVGHFVVPEAHVLGELMGAALSPVPSSIIDSIFEDGAELGLGAIESFMIDSLKVGWTPRAYFDGLRHQGRIAGGGTSHQPLDA